MAQVLKFKGQGFDREINEQTKMLDTLNNNVDHNKLGLNKVDSRLGELVGEMSICKMWTVVVIEIILIVVIMFL